MALAKNLDAVFRGRSPGVYRTDSAPVLAVSLGRSRATGRSGGFKIPSIVVWFVSEFYPVFGLFIGCLVSFVANGFVEGRTLGTQYLLPYVNGTKFRG